MAASTTEGGIRMRLNSGWGGGTVIMTDLEKSYNISIHFYYYYLKLRNGAGVQKEH